MIIALVLIGSPGSPGTSSQSGAVRGLTAAFAGPSEAEIKVQQRGAKKGNILEAVSKRNCTRSQFVPFEGRAKNHGERRNFGDRGHASAALRAGEENKTASPPPHREVESFVPLVRLMDSVL